MVIEKRDWKFAAVVGAVLSLLIWLFGVSGADPATWENFAEVAGLRPPHDLLPGLWRLLTGWTFRLFGIGFAMKLSAVLGAIVAGISLAIFYVTIKLLLSILVRFSSPVPMWNRYMAPGFALMATILLGVSNPFWLISQTFSNDQLHFLMTVVGVYWSINWIVADGTWRIYPIFLWLGMLSAETPVGFVIPFLFMITHHWIWQGIVNLQIERPAAFRESFLLPKWRMFFAFLAGFAVTISVNVWSFINLGGMAANGWELITTYARSAISYGVSAYNSASLLGWVLGMCFSVLPLVVALKVFPSITRDDLPMGFRRGSIMFMAGSFALLQTGLFSSTRFWMFLSDVPLVSSGYFLVMFVAMSMAATVLFLAAFAFAGYGKYVGRLNEDGMMVSVRTPAGKIRYLVPVISGLIVLIAVCRFPKTVEREVLSVVNEAVDEIVDECKGARWLFTDGRLDSAIELAAAANGQKLTVFNMMGGKSTWETNVRTSLFAENSDDFIAAEVGAPALLRQWISSGSEELGRTAIMLGFEMWRQENKSLPEISGMIARPCWDSNATVSNAVARADALAKRVVAIAEAADNADLSPALADAFSAVNWRLARFSHLRKNDELGDELDKANSALERMLSVIDYERQRAFMQVTPREGVKLALYRTNFSDGVRYASIVLNEDEFDPEANFLMGMNAIRKKSFAEAEMYLRKCLVNRPKEPAVHNNLSIVCRKQRKYKEAEEFARKALELLPNSTEVKRTYSDAMRRAP